MSEILNKVAEDGAAALVNSKSILPALDASHAEALHGQYIIAVVIAMIVVLLGHS